MGWQARFVVARRVKVSYGTARIVEVCPGVSLLGRAGKAVYGTHCQGKFRSGRHGETGSGVSVFGVAGKVCSGETGPVGERYFTAGYKPKEVSI